MHARRVRLEPRLVRRGLGADIQAGVTTTVNSTVSSVTNSNAFQTGANLYTTANVYSGGLIGNTIQGAGQNAANSLLSSLPPQVTSAFNVGATIIKNGKPAIDLAVILAKGGQPTEAQCVAAMAAIGGMLNPVVGAGIAAMGAISIGLESALIAVFQACGLYQAPLADWDYVGFIRPNQDSKPYGPQDTSEWLSFRNRIDLDNFIDNGRIATKDLVGYPAYRPNASSSLRNQPFIQLYQRCLLRLGAPSKDTWSQAYSYTCDAPPNPLNDFSKGGTVKGAGRCGGVVGSSTGWNNGVYTTSQSDFDKIFAQMQAQAPTPFEIYFNLMLKKDLEFWANAQPFLPVRTLLAAAATAWNASHTATATTCYAPGKEKDYVLPDAFGPDALGGYGGTTMAYILGPPGGLLDLNTQMLADEPQLCVNAGSLGGVATAQAAQAASATAAKTAAIVAVPAVAAAGTLLYAYATGQAIDTVVKGAWRWLTK